MTVPVLAIALPFVGGVGVPELLIILFIILLLFGPKRLPQLGKTLGKTMKSIREGAEGKLGEGEDDETDEVVTKSSAKTKEAVESKTPASSDDDEA